MTIGLALIGVFLILSGDAHAKGKDKSAGDIMNASLGVVDTGSSRHRSGGSGSLGSGKELSQTVNHPAFQLACTVGGIAVPAVGAGCAVLGALAQMEAMDDQSVANTSAQRIPRRSAPRAQLALVAAPAAPQPQVVEEVVASPMTADTLAKRLESQSPPAGARIAILADDGKAIISSTILWYQIYLDDFVEGGKKRAYPPGMHIIILPAREKQADNAGDKPAVVTAEVPKQ